MATFSELAWRLIVEDDGQDLIEYGLLTGMVTAAGVVVFTSIRTKMADAYVDWGTDIQDYWDLDNIPAP